MFFGTKIESALFDSVDIIAETFFTMLRRLIPFHRPVVYAIVADKSKPENIYVKISKLNNVDTILLEIGSFKCSVDLENPSIVIQLIMEQVQEIIHDRTFVVQSILSRPDVIREFNIKTLMDLSSNLFVILDRLKHIRTVTI